MSGQFYRCILTATLLFASVANAGLPDDIAATLRSHAITRGEFQQEKNLPILSQPLRSSGRFVYRAGAGVLWQVEQPLNSSLVIAPSGIYQDGTLLAGGGGGAIVQTIFQGLLGGDLKDLSTQFAIAAQGNTHRWTLILTPHGEPLSKAISTITLIGGSEAEQLTITEKQGVVTLVKFSGQVHPEQLSAQELKDFSHAR